MISENFTSLILAAGKGVRMVSSLPKVLHPILGKPMLQYVVDAVHYLSIQSVYVVVGYGRDKLQDAFKSLKHVVQDPQNGTGHAVQCYAKVCQEPPNNLLILCGDTPLISKDTLAQMVELHFREKPALTMMTMELPEPGSYGRILRDHAGSITAIREAKDCSADELKNNEVNPAVYLFNGKALFERLGKLSNNNRQKEFYLTDIIEMLVKDGLSIATIRERDHMSTLGINSRSDLAKVTQILRNQILEKHMTAGVTIIDPLQTLIEPNVIIGADTTIWPGTTLIGDVAIGEGCTIGPNSFIENSVLKSKVIVRHTFIRDENIPESCIIEPRVKVRWPKR